MPANASFHNHLPPNQSPAKHNITKPISYFLVYYPYTTRTHTTNEQTLRLKKPTHHTVYPFFRMGGNKLVPQSPPQTHAYMNKSIKEKANLESNES